MSDWKQRLGVVYSTDPNFTYEEEFIEEEETLAPEKQNLRLSISKKHRAGKEVTLVTNFIGTTDDLQALGKTLKQKCGVGGSVKDGEIIIQGDQREKLRGILTKLGYNFKG